MSALTNEYLDNLIKTKIFKDFNTWTKDDFHFLLSLLNYPHYTDLALIVLSNLKNWIIYSDGDFFYPLEQLQKILDKFNGCNYYDNNDIFNENNKTDNNTIKDQGYNRQPVENIKLNILKKSDEIKKYNDIDNDLINIDLETGLLNIGNFLSIDTFKFFIYSIIFFIIITFISLLSNNSNYKNNDFDTLNNFDNLLNSDDLHPSNIFNNKNILQPCNILNELFNTTDKVPIKKEQVKKVPIKKDDNNINIKDILHSDNIFNILFNNNEEEVPVKKDNLHNNKEDIQSDNILNTLFNDDEIPIKKNNLFKNILKYASKIIL